MGLFCLLETSLMGHPGISIFDACKLDIFNCLKNTDFPLFPSCKRDIVQNSILTLVSFIEYAENKYGGIFKIIRVLLLEDQVFTVYFNWLIRIYYNFLSKELEYNYCEKW